MPHQLKAASRSRFLGLLPINRVTAAKANPKSPRRAERRIEKSARIEDKTIAANGQLLTITLYARGGAVGIGELTETGDLTFIELPRIRTHRNRDKNGRYRWYNDYQLPDRYGDQTITVRLHTNADDTARRFNRAENVRPIPPSDPDFARLYPRRNDAESINRNIEDSLWIGRAHSIGHAPTPQPPRLRPHGQRPRPAPIPAPRTRPTRRLGPLERL